MSAEIQESGIDIIGQVPWGTHFCQFYQTKEDLIDILVPYFKAGLENNEFCMWVTSEPLPVEEAERALRLAVPNIDKYLEKGRLEIIPYTEWYVIEGEFDSVRVLNGWVDKLNTALHNGFNGLRLTGNTFWLEKDDWNDFVDYEEEVDSVIGNYNMIAMCTYCLDKSNASEIIDVVSNHDFAVIKRKGEWILVESSKQKKIENELESVREKYDSLFNNMIDGYAHCEMIYDNQGKSVDFIYLKVNDSFEHLTGVKNVEGKKVSEAIPGTIEAHPELFEIYSRVATTGNPEKFEIEFKPLNKWFNIAVHSPQKNQFIAVFENITKRKKAEQALNQSQKLLNDVINGFLSAIFVKDLEGRFLIINSKLEELLGVKNEEIRGKTDYDIITKELADDYRANDQKVLEEGKPIAIEEEADLIDGTHTFIANKFPIYDIKGEPYGVGSISTDITERKLLEEKIQNLADLVESSNDAIITKSLEGIITSWNKGAEQIYGYNSEEIVGKNISILAPSSLKNEISDLIEKIVQGKQIRHYETLRVKKNGELINISITLSPVLDASGKLVAISTIARDITENKKAEEKMQQLLLELQASSEELTSSNEELQATTEELKTSNEELQLQMDFEVEAKIQLEEIARKLKISNKELEQFAYVASHDLQEPLRMVTSFTQLLERRYKNKLDADADAYIEFIVEGGKRMKYLIDDLLEFSRLNTQKREFESVLLKITLEDVLRNLSASIKENNAQISHDPLPTIIGDPSQINQLLQNLITNAIKFHGDEQPQVHISAEESKGEWIIGVSDKGIGIDPEHQEQIFRIFKRLHTREEYAGTGIGLAICKRIVERHNGKI